MMSYFIVIGVVLRVLLPAWLMDRLFGDPVSLPHPVIWFGKMIAFGEKRLNKGSYKLWKGGIMSVLLILFVYSVTIGIEYALSFLGTPAVIGFDIICIFFCLAGTTLIKEVRMVFEAVDRSLEEGRIQVARIVGRDTSELSAQEVRTAALETLDGVLDEKIACGTRNFAKEPAMTEKETLDAIDTGVRLVKQCKENGYQILATGEMGIGNTTTSSAVTAALLHRLASETAGRGAGLNDKGLSRKKQVIQEAIDKYDLYKADAFTVLQTVGGFDIAGLTGVFIGGAMYHVPIVLDGLISGAAALLAKRIIPGTEHFMIASHLGKEPAAKAILKEIGIKPVIHGDLALGEGTGAVMVFSLLDLAMSVYNGHTDFSRLEMAPYERLS